MGDNTIPENADIVYPPANVREVGHAGVAYSGTNAYRGSYNVNESGAIDGGYRHVWDFGTDKANGEIKCLSLTSKTGGNIGLHYDDSSGYNAMYVYELCRKSSNYNYILGRVAKNKYAFRATSTGKTVRINYGNVFDSDSITLTETTGTGFSIIDTKEISVNNPNSSYDHTNLTDSPIMYAHNYSGNTVWYAKINYATGEVIKDTTVTLSIPSDYKQSIYYVNGINNDYIYACLYDTNNNNYPYCIGRFTHDGVFCELVTTSSIYCIGDKWYIGENGITTNGEKISLNNGYGDRQQCYDYVGKDIRPLYLSLGYSSSDSQVALCLYNTYLGTINNLATPVTKTNAQTMKITYDLIQG